MFETPEGNIFINDNPSIDVSVIYPILTKYRGIRTASLVLWLTCLTTDHEVAGSIPGNSTNFKCGFGLERGPPSLMRTIG